MTTNQIAIASLMLASFDAVAISQLGDCRPLQILAALLLIVSYLVAFAALAEENSK